MSTPIYISAVAAVALCMPVAFAALLRKAGLTKRRLRTELTPTDQEHLLVAECFLSQGNCEAALRELHLLSGRGRLSQPALRLRYTISAAQSQWGRCRELASLMLNLAPQKAQAWAWLKEQANRSEAKDEPSL